MKAYNTWIYLLKLLNGDPMAGKASPVTQLPVKP
jgi:hypothetical protein